MIVSSATGERAADAVGKTLAAQIRASHPLRRDHMMHDRAWRKADRAAVRDDSREQLGILSRDWIAADHAQVLAEISEALECRALESDVGAEIVDQLLDGFRSRRGNRALVVNGQLDPQ